MGGIAFQTPKAEARAKLEAEGQRRKSLEVREIIGGKPHSNYDNYGQLWECDRNGTHSCLSCYILLFNRQMLFSYSMFFQCFSMFFNVLGKNQTFGHLWTVGFAKRIPPSNIAP